MILLSNYHKTVYNLETEKEMLYFKMLFLLLYIYFVYSFNKMIL